MGAVGKTGHRTHCYGQQRLIHVAKADSESPSCRLARSTEPGVAEGVAHPDLVMLYVCVNFLVSVLDLKDEQLDR